MRVSAVRRRAIVPALVLVLGLAAPAAGAEQRPWMDRSKSPDDRAAALVAALTLPEKISLATGVFGCVGKGSDGYNVGSARLGLPDLHFVGAGMGVSGGICPNRANGGKATLLPAPLAMAASWDPDVAYEDGALIGRETRATGFNVSIGGSVNLARDPRAGRTFENEGEDPLLAGTMVGAQLKGTRDQKIVPTIKHYALNNEEVNRLTASSEVDERTMRQLELRAFEIGIRDAGAVMCSYNKVNGVPACQHRELLTDVLRRDWGFKGWVMTDWWACTIPAVFDPADMCSTTEAALAGLDQQQPNPSFFGPALLAAVLTGQVPQARLDEMAHRIVRTMFDVGIVDDPPRATPLDAHAGARVAQRVAERSAVLLRNARATLPLRKRDVRTVAVLGAPANEKPPAPGSPLAIPPAEDGSSVHVEPLITDTPLEGLRNTAPDTEFRYADGADPAAAAKLAAESDVAIVYARDTLGEGKNLPALTLDDGADALIAAVAKANPRTVVVLMNGTAVTMPWVEDVGAVLAAWYPGARGGHAIARLLFGDANPSGRLPLTFPRRVEDLPTAGDPAAWPGDADRIVYSEKLLMGYPWFDAKGIEPLFAFGHGLSYGGRFAYADAKAGERSVTFTLANAGTRTASEVPQVYAELPASAGEPPRRLVGWQKLRLRPGERRRVTIAFTDRDLAVWDAAADRWTVPSGTYRFRVGASSRDLRLTALARRP